MTSCTPYRSLYVPTKQGSVDCFKSEVEEGGGRGTQGKARQGKARQGKARQGKARQGKARQGKARQGKARQGKSNLFDESEGAVLI